MAITNFRNRFANSNAAPSAQQGEKRQAKYWMNIGYQTGDEKYPFVSLPLGIPLDIEDKLTITGSPEFANLRAAQNDLLEDVISECEKLAPGEETILDCGNNLAIQLRHVRGEQSVDREANPLGRRMAFGAQPEQPAADAAAE